MKKKVILAIVFAVCEFIGAIGTLGGVVLDAVPDKSEKEEKNDEKAA